MEIERACLPEEDELEEKLRELAILEEALVEKELDLITLKTELSTLWGAICASPDLAFRLCKDIDRAREK